MSRRAQGDSLNLADWGVTFAGDKTVSLARTVVISVEPAAATSEDVFRKYSSLMCIYNIYTYLHQVQHPARQQLGQRVPPRGGQPPLQPRHRDHGPHQGDGAQVRC